VDQALTCPNSDVPQPCLLSRRAATWRELTHAATTGTWAGDCGRGGELGAEYPGQLLLPRVTHGTQPDSRWEPLPAINGMEGGEEE